jgi:CO/xanthine dehydrogenase Mo-binding subunit
VVGAIGNAFFDATGVRIRQFPLTPTRVLAALKAGSSSRSA